MKHVTQLLVCAALAIPSIAVAQNKSADDYYKEGETAYNLADFDKAIESFKKGYELEPDESKKAAYLYNVGQSYRQKKDCANARFFYKRYLAIKDNDTKKPLRAEKRKEIEDKIRELDDCVAQQEAIKNSPPDQNLNPGAEDKPDPTTDVATRPDPTGDITDTDGDDADDGISASTTTQPRVISVRGFGGGAKLSTGDLEVPIQATFGLIAGYPLALGDKLTLELGAGFTFTPVPYEQTTTQMSKTASLVGAFANVGASFAVAPKIGLRADLGLGGRWFNGISESPFTDGNETTGAVPMFVARVAVSAEYAVTPNFLVTLIPVAFSYSPAPDGLREDISSITAIDFMVGLGYRM